MDFDLLSLKIIDYNCSGSESAQSELLLGSAILLPSHIPEWNPRTQYVVHIYLSFTPDWFPPHIWTSLLCTIYLLRLDSEGIRTWPGPEDQGSEMHLADSYWLSFSHRYCRNEMSEVEVSQPAGVRNRLQWPFERHRDGGLRSKQRGRKEVM